MAMEVGCGGGGWDDDDDDDASPPLMTTQYFGFVFIPSCALEYLCSLFKTLSSSSSGDHVVCDDNTPATTRRLPVLPLVGIIMPLYCRGGV